MASLRQHISHLWRSASAVPGTLREYVRFRRQWKGLKDRLPAGDGHPVLVLPGMLTGDFFYKNFRRHIEEKGYRAHPWNNGVNMGLSRQTAARLKKRLEEVYAESGGQKVTLIGHSLGGIYARELAREFPEMVRDVITMGTPIGGMSGGDAIPDLLRRIFNRFTKNPEWQNNPELDQRGLTPPPVPVSSIYSKDDPIIKWQACLNPAAEGCENIEVSTTHVGLTFAPPSLVAIFDRLAQKEGDWKRFNAEAYKDLAAYRPSPPAAELPENPGWKPETAKMKGLFVKK
ncbi:MAG: alpha/beta fold hydrolase [Alphaproteobacteria bacterium]|nr:MAG: alpha/beta fold hydrolase [Alphaproteobacteria bacterium]